MAIQSHEPGGIVSYRAQQPVIDALLSEIGIKGGDISDMISGALPDSTLVAASATDGTMTPPKAQKKD